MTEIQMEEIKATVCMVGIASASDWVFRVLMIVLTLCFFGLVMVLKKKQRLEDELEQFKGSNPRGHDLRSNIVEPVVVCPNGSEGVK